MHLYLENQRENQIGVLQNQRIKQSQKITKIRYLETREKMEFIDISFVIFG